MDPLSLINNSLEIASKLKKCSDSIANAEMKMLFADLSNNLADTKIEISSLKIRNQELEAEISKLKSEEFTTKPTIRSSCYQFDGDQNLYCISCYEKNKKKSPSFSWKNIAMICSVCNKDTPL